LIISIILCKLILAMIRACCRAPRFTHYTLSDVHNWYMLIIRLYQDKARNGGAPTHADVITGLSYWQGENKGDPWPWCGGITGRVWPPSTVEHGAFCCPRTRTMIHTHHTEKVGGGCREQEMTMPPEPSPPGCNRFKG